MIELLTQDDKDIITEMRCKGTGMDENVYGWLPTSRWLSYWDTAKSRYLNRVFGDQLILSKKIQYNLSVYEISSKINKEVFNDYLKPENRQYVNFRSRFKEAFRYLYEGGKDEEYWAICSLMDSDNLASNELDYSGHRSSWDIPIPHMEKPFRLQRGAKVSKAIGRLCTLMNIDGWEPMRLKISQILNDSHISGKLCLSIHPMDFLSASVNENRWSSCMHFYDGEYRRGVVEMMNSEMVVCAYIESTHESIDVNGYEWNSKKWREFFIVDPSCISGIKGYPFCNPQLEGIVIDWLKELVINSNVFPEVKWNEKPTTFNTSSKIYIEATDSFFEIPVFECGPAMYNDFYSGNEYLAYFSDVIDRDSYDVFYSGYSECAICGGDDWDGYYDEDYAGSLLICYKCDPTIRCDCCGDRYNERDMYEVNGLHYCQYCYERMPVCDICGNVFDPEQGGITETALAAADTDDVDVKPDILRSNITICHCCEDDAIKSESNSVYNKYYRGGPWHCNYYYISLSDLTDKAKQAIFGTDDDGEIISNEIGDDSNPDEENNSEKEQQILW